MLLIVAILIQALVQISLYAFTELSAEGCLFGFLVGTIVSALLMKNS